MEKLSPEVQSFCRRVAETLGSTDYEVLEVMALSFMAERRAQVQEGVAANEIATFPRESDGTLTTGRDAYQYAGIKHRVRLQNVKAAEEKLARLEAGIDQIFLMARGQAALLSKTWASIRSKLDRLGVTNQIPEEIIGMRAGIVFYEKMVDEINKAKALVA